MRSDRQDVLGFGGGQHEEVIMIALLLPLSLPLPFLRMVRERILPLFLTSRNQPWNTPTGTLLVYFVRA